MVIDLGTGDGRFVYRSALRDPEKFFIGIDPNVRPLAKVSEKTYRRPEKGGTQNALFLQATIENLPRELNGVADKVHVQFPWGSLLRAVATGEEVALRKLRRLCRKNARLEIKIGVDPNRDHSEHQRLGLPDMTAMYVGQELIPRYQSGGFKIVDYGIHSASEWPAIESSWASRLRQSSTRKLIYLSAVVIDDFSQI